MTPCPCCQAVPDVDAGQVVHDPFDPAALACPYAAIAIPVGKWPPPADPLEAPDLFLPDGAEPVPRQTLTDTQKLQVLATACITWWNAQPVRDIPVTPLFVRLARSYIRS